MAEATATNANTDASVLFSMPVATIAPTMVIPETALDPDMSGVCSVGGTLVINSNPTKEASTNTTMAMTTAAGIRCSLPVPGAPGRW